jgi:hypothetical protein
VPTAEGPALAQMLPTWQESSREMRRFSSSLVTWSASSQGREVPGGAYPAGFPEGGSVSGAGVCLLLFSPGSAKR